MEPNTREEPPRVLLVDDDAANLLALEAVLEPLNQPIMRRARARARCAWCSSTVAVILLDLRMPAWMAWRQRAISNGKSRGTRPSSFSRQSRACASTLRVRRRRLRGEALRASHVRSRCRSSWSSTSAASASSSRGEAAPEGVRGARAAHPRGPCGARRAQRRWLDSILDLMPTRCSS